MMTMPRPTRIIPSPSSPEQLEAERAALEAEVERMKAAKRARLLAELAAVDEAKLEQALPAQVEGPAKLDAAAIMEPFRQLLEKNAKDPTYLARAAAAEWAQILEDLKPSNLPPRFHFRLDGWHPALKAAWERKTEMKLDGWHRAQKLVYERCRKHFTGKGAIVALVGVRGAGKTTIGAQLMIDRVAKRTGNPWERAVGYYKLTELIARFKALYADHGSINSEELLATRRAWAAHPFRVIDEVHEGDDIRMKGRVMTDLLDRCYNQQTDVLLISNQKEQEFLDTTSDSVLSRISEHGEIIRCEWESFRAKAEARRRAK